MNSHALPLAFAIGLISSFHAVAFDDLIRMAPAFPLASPYIFDYTAPLGGFAADAPTAFGPSDEQIAAALLQASRPDVVTGVDFSAVRAVLSMGDPPSTLTVLFGQDRFAAAAPSALAGRGLEASELDGLPVLSLGDDYAVDFANARQPDPFAQGMGKSQRILVGDDFLIRSAGWPELRSAMAALAAPSLDAQMWTAMIEGLRATSGDAAHLDIATGFSGSAFFDPGPDVGELLADPEATIKARSKAAPQENIIFPFALFALTQNGEQASVQIALAFSDESLAIDAGKVISDRIVVHPETPARPRVDIEPVGYYWIAVLSVDFPPTEASSARDLYSHWMGDIYQRQFQPLMLSF